MRHESASRVPLESLGFSAVYDYAVGEFLSDLVQRMQKGGVGSILVTKPSGHLVGMMRRSDAEEVLAHLEHAHDHD